MGAASRGGTPAIGALGGVGAVLEVRHPQHALGTNITPGAGGFSGGGFARYGGGLVTLPGLNGYDIGSGGQTPTRGYENTLNIGWKHARNTAAGNTPFDWYCGVMPTPILQKPPSDLGSGFAVWEVSSHIMLSGVPAAPITRDCGQVFVMSANTSFANCLRAGVAAGNDYAGFGVVWDGLGDLLWIVKKSGAGGGAPLSESVTLGTYGALRPVWLKIRIYSATKASEAKVEVYLDNVLALVRYWGPGTVLPVAADATFSASFGNFRPLWRAAQETATNVRFLWRDECFRAASAGYLLD